MVAMKGFHIGNIMGTYATADKLSETPLVYNFDYRDYLQED
jgi:hypothetical protein